MEASDRLLVLLFWEKKIIIIILVYKLCERTSDSPTDTLYTYTFIIDNTILTNYTHHTRTHIQMHTQRAIHLSLVFYRPFFYTIIIVVIIIVVTIIGCTGIDVFAKHTYTHTHPLILEIKRETMYIFPLT